MPFYDQRYQLLRGGPSNFVPVAVIQNLVADFQITSENLVIVNSGGGGPPPRVLLPPITAQNQGRAIYVTKRNNVDNRDVTVAVGAPGDEIALTEAQVTSVLVPDGSGRLFVAWTHDFGAGPVNVWWAVGAEI